jgi:uncharacterized membrane protein YhhN
VTAARSFAATWWAVRPKLGEGLVFLGLVAFVALWQGWPLLSVPIVWLAVQFAAMSGYAAYLVRTGRPLPGESDG